MKSNTLVSYTKDKKTIHGILMKVGNSNYILHNENGFPGNGYVSYDPWVKEFGQKYKYYIHGFSIKNVKAEEGVYELWN